jgi:hypothetical protein
LSDRAWQLIARRAACHILRDHRHSFALYLQPWRRTGQLDLE